MPAYGKYFKMKYAGKEKRNIEKTENMPQTPNIFVLLHNIRSAHNIGAIFRTADGAGIAKIFLTGHTPTPIDRFGRPQAEIAKTALGAEESVPWSYHENDMEVLEQCRNDGFDIVVIEQHVRSIDYRSFQITNDTLLVFGSETDGVSDEVCVYADTVIELPMRGVKESLNVATTTGIILYAYTS